MSSMDANKKKRRLVAGILFIIYFIVLFYFLFFSEELGRTYTERTYHYNLVPFKEIKRFIQYRNVLGQKAVLLNVLGNILAFVPFGAFVPIFSKRCRRIWVTVLYSFELSLLVELLQLIFRVGSFDVDDLMLNTLGGMIGFLIYCAVLYVWEKVEKGENGGGNGAKKA